MNLPSPFLSVNYSCHEALAWLQERFLAAELRVMRTFDLQSARLGLADCPCPHHGTTECDCQMVVLLVYHDMDEPVTLILHGSDGQTWLSLINQPSQQVNPGAAKAIQQALESKAPVDP